MESPFTNRNGDKIEITDLYRGRECFLVCGGPSANDLPLEKLAQRGVLIASFNNCPAVLPANVRPHIWLFNDTPVKFHEDLYQDSAILKFMPVTLWNRQKRNWKVYTKDPATGELKPSRWYPIDMPCSLAYHRQYDFDPDTFLNKTVTINKTTFGAVSQGNDKEHALAVKSVKNRKTGLKEEQPIPGRKPNGWPRVINSMFSALSIPYFLGIRTVYLVGCDFRMSVDKPYGFNQSKHRGGVIENNRHFRDMALMFRALKPKFDAAGYNVFNCYLHSGLADDQGLIFPYKPFEECLSECRRHAPFAPKIDASGWYDAQVVNA